MTSYLAMGERGREAAAETHRRYLLRSPVDVRLGVDGHGLRQWQVIGDCGHIIHSIKATLVDYRTDDVHPLSGYMREILMRKRRRCSGCPRQPTPSPDRSLARELADRLDGAS